MPETSTDVIADALRDMDYGPENPARDEPGVWDAYVGMAKAIEIYLERAGYVIERERELFEEIA